MAEKSVVREDVVSISFDIEDDCLKELNDMMKELQEITEDVTRDIGDALEDISEEFEDVSDIAGETAKELEKGFDDVTKTVKDTGHEISKTAKDMNRETENASKGLKNNFVNSLKKVKSGVSDVESKVTKTASKFKNFVNTKFDKLINGLSKFNKKADESTEKVKDLAKESESAGGGIKRTIAKAAGVFAIGAALTNAVTTGMNFEAGMSTVKAVSGATDTEMEKLTAKAEEMGRTTVFSASEAADALNYMAMAGWKSEQMLNGIDGIMNLAAASGEDLGTTSDIVTDALTAFGENADAAADFADVLAMASSNANTNVAMMGETFKYVAPFAGALKYDYKDVAAAIGLMANSGIKASQAGTSLRSLFANLSAPTDGVAAAMERLNLSLTDSNGNMKDFHTVMSDIRKGFKNIEGESERAAVATALAGKNASSGLLAIANASEEDFNKIMNAVNNASGAAEEMANIKNDNLLGQITLLKSGIESVYNEFYKYIKVPLKNGVKWITENIVPKIVKGIDGIAEKLGPVFEKTAPVIKSVIDGMALKFEWFRTNVLPSLIEGFNTIKNAVIPVIQTIAEKAAGLFDRIFGLVMMNKDTILNAWNSICGLFTYFTDAVLPELVNVFNWAVQTLAPVVSDVINIVCQAVNGTVPFVKEAVEDIISAVKGISPIVQSIAKIISGVIKKISQNMDKVVPVLKLMAKGYILVKTAMLAYKGVALALNAVLKAQAIWTAAVSAVETAYIVTLYAADTAMKILNATIAAGPWGWLAIAIGAVVAVGAGFIAWLDDSDEKLEATKKQIAETAAQVEPFAETIKNCVPKTVDFSKGIFGETLSKIQDNIDEAEKKITDILSRRYNEQQALRMKDLDNIRGYQKQIEELNKEKVSVYQKQMDSEKTRFKLLGENVTPEQALQYKTNMEDYANQLIETADDVQRDAITTIEGNYAAMGLTNPLAVQVADMAKNIELKRAQKIHDNEAAKAQIMVDEAYAAYNRVMLKDIRPDLNKWRGVGENVQNDYGQSGLMKKVFDRSGFEGDIASRKYEKDIKNTSADELQKMNNIIITAAETKNKGREVEAATKYAVSDILSMYDGLDEDMEEIGKNSILGAINGMEEYIPGLRDTSTMTCQEIVDTIKAYLGIQSPSKVMEELGMYTMQGFNNGIQGQRSILGGLLGQIASGIPSAFKGINLFDIGKNIVSGLVKGLNSSKTKVTNAVTSVALAANNAVTKTLDIHSPSRVMRWNGQMIGEGLILGMKDKMSDIQTGFDNLDTDMSMGYTPENSTDNSSISTHTETNNISPNITVYVNGGNGETEERTKYALEELFEEFFAGYGRRSPRTTEV